MTTRHLICVIKDKQYRLAQYGCWDGYLEGQGKAIAEFLQVADIGKFAAQIDKVTVLSLEEVNMRWAAAYSRFEQDPRRSWWTPPEILHLSRDCGSRILYYVMTEEAPEVYLSLSFAGESLFCEYCYVIDLDRACLEIFTGLNRSPLAEDARFYGFEQHEDNRAAFARLVEKGTPFYPVKHFRTVAFEALTPTLMADLAQEISDPEEDDEPTQVILIATVVND